MAYWHDIYVFYNSIEHEYKFAGSYGAKGEKREKKKKPTKEQMARQNQINRENRTRRLIKANFRPMDLWCCCKYPAGVRMPLEEIKKDRKGFFDRLRSAYRKHNAELKYVYRLEVSGTGGVHLHVLVNRIWTAQTDVLIGMAWQATLKNSWCSRDRPVNRTDGLVDWKTTYEAGGYAGLADYLTKKPEEGSDEYEQLSLFPKEERKYFLAVQSSRNLVRPEPERHYYSRRTMRKLIEEGPRAEEGYYIDYDTLYIGRNPYTGLSYCRYTEVRLDSPDGDMFREVTPDADG